MYRASLRSLKLAKEAVEKRKSVEIVSELVADEIEASAMCILGAHTCLEAYINSIIQDCCSDYHRVLERMSVTEKWFITPRLMGSSDCFVLNQKPYCDFEQLNSWRNDIAHFAHRWEKVGTVGGLMSKAGKAYSVCNEQNAEKAIAIISEMIGQLALKTKTPKPSWLGPAGLWLKDVI